MENDQIVAVHSKFFADTIKRNDVAREVFSLYLPEKILGLIDLNALTAKDTHFVDERFKDYYSDVLFTAPMLGTDKPLNIYLLIEHKSHPYKKAPVQMLGYTACIHDEQEEYAPVIAVLVHHGPEKWVYPVKFTEQGKFTPEQKEALADYPVDFRYVLIDLEPKKVLENNASGLVRAFLYLLAVIWHLKTADNLEKFLALFPDLFYIEPGLLTRFVFYMLEAGDITPERFQKAVIEAVPEEKAKMAMSALEERDRKFKEKFKEEYMEEGKLKGKLEGKLEDARNFIKYGVALDIVLKSTGLTRDQLLAAGIELPH